MRDKARGWITWYLIRHVKTLDFVLYVMEVKRSNPRNTFQYLYIERLTRRQLTVG